VPLGDGDHPREEPLLVIREQLSPIDVLAPGVRPRISRTVTTTMSRASVSVSADDLIQVRERVVVADGTSTLPRPRRELLRPTSASRISWN
jgi:hypothetical protein